MAQDTLIENETPDTPVLIPITCGTEKCPRFGEVINVVSGATVKDLDFFYEGYDSSDPADHCPSCGEWGIAEDPELADWNPDTDQ